MCVPYFCLSAPRCASLEGGRGLPSSSERPEDWELNTHIEHERSASFANVTVKVTGPRPSSWGWGPQARWSLPAELRPGRAALGGGTRQAGLLPGPQRALASAALPNYLGSSGALQSLRS